MLSSFPGSIIPFQPLVKCTDKLYQPPDDAVRITTVFFIHHNEIRWNEINEDSEANHLRFEK